jgi:DNA polymerase III subunit gamma/tau
MAVQSLAVQSMSYLVLARKWRPKRFAELVGQEHVVRALSNALDTGRVHHAFLFTGTRGVGKTTIARIFAKSLNCERGVGAEPCGECAVCTSVDAGRFVDLIEIDAASNTGVDDVRDVIENAQYMPTRGRYKVYLIDEVHMLTRHAFNALLKTLEEPPEHVKFLLATTDPQKLPVTVLSRCLQFNLKRLTPEQITAQMRMILNAEGIAFDEGALAQLSHGADGSLRDGLSLLDQAIAYAGGALANDAVAAMLGTVDRAQVDALLAALAAGDGPALLAAVDHLAGFSPDFDAVLQTLASALHQIQLSQLVPGAVELDDALAAVAPQVTAELVQLWYQMALSGRRELPMAPSPRAGFEMTVLRMLAFRPLGGEGVRAPAASQSASATPVLSARSAAPPSAPVAPKRAADVRTAPVVAPPPVPVATPVAPAQVSAPAYPTTLTATTTPAPAAIAAPTGTPVPTAAASPHADAPNGRAAPGRRLFDSDDWLQIIGGLNLRGPVRELAASAAFVEHDGTRLRLSLPEVLDHLRLPSLVTQLSQALAPVLGGAPQIEFAAATARGETLHDRNRRERDSRQADAERAFVADPAVQRLMSQYDARLIPDSIRPADDI